MVAAYRAGARVSQALPEPLVGPVSRVAGIGFGQAMRGRRDIIARHLRRVHGPQLEGTALRRAVDRAFDSYARYWVESFRLPTCRTSRSPRTSPTKASSTCARRLADGKGVILALPHLGGWEWAGRWIADCAIPITVVVEPLEPPELFEWFADFRRSLGMNVVPLGPGAASAAIKAVKANGVVCLLCDRDIGGGGIEVEFFGERTTLPAGRRRSALRTGAPVLPTAVYFRRRRPPRHRGAAARHRRVTVRCPRTSRASPRSSRIELEDLIRIAPEQWHLLQPNWPSDPGYKG